TLGKDDFPAVAPRRAAAGKRRGHTADDSRSAPCNGGPHQQTILVPTEVGTVWGPEGTGEGFSGREQGGWGDSVEPAPPEPFVIQVSQLPAVRRDRQAVQAGGFS